MDLKKALLRFVVGLTWFVFTACALQTDISVEVLPAYDALFANESGWTGADGVYSIMLSDESVLWLFGDTWVGQIEGGRHVNATIVNNSIALQHGLNPIHAAVEFYHGQTPEGAPAAFLRPEKKNSWFWIYHGALTPGGLFLFLIQIERTGETAAFGFKAIGSWLGHVANPHHRPTAWQIDIRRIPWERFAESGNTFFGSALLEKDGYTYIYGITEVVADGRLRKHMIVARVATTSLGDFNRWRFYANGRWDADAAQVSPICENVANEYSVSYLPELQQYILVYSEDGISENIMVRLASEPYGPWSEPHLIYRCPEAGWDETIFCYAGKAHPGIALDAAGLVVTYVANSTDFDKIASDARLYRPRFLRVRIQTIPGINSR